MVRISFIIGFVLVFLLTAIGSCAVAAASPYDEVLTPPEHWPIQHWNPNGVSGAESWLVIFILVSAAAVACWFAREWYLSSQRRCRMGGPQKARGQR
ncbi:MAG TPA: hypothetical protein VK254_04650 [Candidatus Bathyarchaeia archaeon]|nr:hypothetical protein [Candidatus Bathyarchaeia archaeon]